MATKDEPGGVEPEWQTAEVPLLPASLYGASEEEKRAAIASGTLGTARLRYRVVPVEVIEARKRAAEEKEESDGERQEPSPQQ